MNEQPRTDTQTLILALEIQAHCDETGLPTIKGSARSLMDEAAQRLHDQHELLRECLQYVSGFEIDPVGKALKKRMREMVCGRKAGGGS